MAVVIRKAIHDDQTVVCAKEHIMLSITLRLLEVSAQETAATSFRFLIDGTNILHPPRSPYVLVVVGHGL